MRAAVIREFGRPPDYTDFADPTPQSGETIVTVTASAINVLTLSRAAGAHYTADSTLPVIPGVDGVGTTPDGTRVYFQQPRPPYGGLAERAPALSGRLVPVPDGLDDVSAAAAAIPGMSCWLPLSLHARVRPGESVLVNGATGASGQMAIQVAKHFGARQVIATGRDESQLGSLSEIGADSVISLAQPTEDLRRAIRNEAARSSIGVVLDYLWGPSAENIIGALGGPRAPRGAERIRYVSIGSIGGESIPMPSALLRSSGLEILGSGFGSVTPDQALTAIREFFGAYAGAHFRISTEPHPLSEVARLWGRTGGGRRLVFTPR